MKVSQLFMPTLREVPAEADTISHRLMLRAGLIRKLASGIYAFLPLGLKTFKKIEQIIREEMDEQGAQELIMSSVLPAEYYKASGRWDVFGPEMFKLKDRSGRDFCLGPTHEEIFTSIVKNEIRSYRALPLILYQIQTKFRDERRPRFGVMRGREFVMKDAYSFDRDEAGLDISYKKMHEAYCRSFDRMGLEYIVVEADSGAMGGSGSEEFMVKSEIGEAAIAFCESCGYAANEEKAKCVPEKALNTDDDFQEMGKVSTPDVKTIEQLVEFFNTTSKMFAKTLIYKADDEFVAAVVRGDRELNETKLTNLLKCGSLEMAEPEDIMRVTNAPVGFAGPVNLGLKVIIDNEIAGMKNFITGANEEGYHFVNVNIERDFRPDVTADIRTIEDGDKCPKCAGDIRKTRGIEVGHIFKLGTKYSEALDCRYLDENGDEKVMVMGSYGIGVGRTMAAIIEQNSDENGLIWPVSVAPYHAVIVVVNQTDELHKNVSQKLYEQMKKAGIDVLIDDRDERPGVKFKDADLIGIPARITVGRKAKDGLIEYKRRDSGEVIELKVDEAIEYTKKDLGL